MARNKSSISRASSYRDISNFWETHDLAEYWEQTEPAAFEIDIQSEATYFPVEKALSVEISKIARKKGVSPETLLNLWLQERMRREQLTK